MYSLTKLPLTNNVGFNIIRLSSNQLSKLSTQTDENVKHQNDEGLFG